MFDIIDARYNHEDYHTLLSARTFRLVLSFFNGTKNVFIIEPLTLPQA